MELVGCTVATPSHPLIKTFEVQVVQASQPNSGSYYTDCVVSKNAAFRGF